METIEVFSIKLGLRGMFFLCIGHSGRNYTYFKKEVKQVNIFNDRIINLVSI